jgi:hypothetical protein
LFTGSAAAIGFVGDGEASRTTLVENKSGVPRSVGSRPMVESCRLWHFAKAKAQSHQAKLRMKEALRKHPPMLKEVANLEFYVMPSGKAKKHETAGNKRD